MRVYNGKNSNLEMPIGNGQKLVVGPKSVSGDFLPSTNFITMLVSSFDYNEIALIVSGVQELNLCASVSAAAGFVCHSLSEAVDRFANKKSELKENPALLKDEEKKEEETKATKKEKASAKKGNSEDPKI